MCIDLPRGASMKTSNPILETGYTATAKLLHWLVAALLIMQFTVAWFMPHIGRNTKPDSIINLHFSFGAVILLVVILRLGWRWTHREPAPLDGIPPWRAKSARAVHTVLYLLLLVIPVLGWMNASWRGFDVSVFGLFTLPRLMTARAPGFGWTGDVHTILSWYVMLAFLALHVAAALHHALVRRDGTLARMLPGG
jgi:cytochrome b561